MNIDKVTVAKQVLRNLDVVYDSEYRDEGYSCTMINEDIDEDLIINAMLVYLDKIEQLKQIDK